MIVTTLLLILTTAMTVPPAIEPPRTPPPVVVETLQMNPEKPREIVGWWIGPEGLIEIAADGRFRSWPTADRFMPPKHFGRWHRENHAVLWLEPYSIPKVERQRAALWLRDDDLMADLTGSKSPFQWRSTPPRVPADDLLGIWEGPGGVLSVTADLRYRWEAPTSDRPAMLAGQRGIWRLDADGKLHLTPMLFSQDPVISIARRDLEGRIIQLRTPMGTIDRRPPPPPPTIESEASDATKTDDEPASTPAGC